MTKVENAVAISEPMTSQPSMLIPYPAIAITSQEFPATLVMAKTLLLLTSGPQFNRTATLAHSKPTQSSASQSRHTIKLPSGTPSNAKDFLDAAEVQVDLLLINQHTIIANQSELQAHQQALKKRMDKMEDSEGSFFKKEKAINDGPSVIPLDHIKGGEV